MAERWSTCQARAWACSAECSHLCRLAADKETQYPGLTRILCSRAAEFLRLGVAIAIVRVDGRLLLVEAESGNVQLDVGLSAGYLSSVAWSPDGGLVATAGLDGNLRVVEAKSGHVQLDVVLSAGDLSSAAWSPDGGLVATAAGDGRLCVVEPGSGHVQLDVGLCAGYLSSAAWSPDGGLVATVGFDGHLRVVEPGSGHVQLDVGLSARCLLSAAWSPDGGLVATAGLDGHLRVVEAGSGQVQLDVRLSAGHLSSAAWSPDGGLVATAAGDGRLCVVEPGSGQAQLEVWEPLCLRCPFDPQGPARRSLTSVAWEPLCLFGPSRAAAGSRPGGSAASEIGRRGGGAAAADSVIDTIAHTEPAVALDEYTAALGGDIAWVEQVEQGLLERARLPEAGVTAAASAAAVPAEDPDPEARSGSGDPAMGVYILRFGSPPRGGDSWERFREELLRSPQLHPHIKAMDDARFSCELLGGALIIVAPEQYEDMTHALVGWQLQPYNVVIAEQFECLLEEFLASLSYNRRPKLKQGARGRQQLAGSSAAASPETRARGSSSGEAQGFAAPAGGDEAQDFAAPAGGDEEPEMLWLLRAERTFLTYAPAPRPARTVAQSTTEAVARQSEAHYGSYRGSNPRRLRHDELS